LDGEPFSETAGKNMISGANKFYQEMSYGKAGFTLVDDGSDITPTFRMPDTAEYYGARDPSVLRRAARSAAVDAACVSAIRLRLDLLGPVPALNSLVSLM
jgi:hypothetical protein